MQRLLSQGDIGGAIRLCEEQVAFVKKPNELCMALWMYGYCLVRPDVGRPQSAQEIVAQIKSLSLDLSPNANFRHQHVLGLLPRGRGFTSCGGLWATVVKATRKLTRRNLMQGVRR